MGGEKTLYSGMQQVVLGSSPRWRGKDRFLATQSLVLRITPAWAGKRLPHPQRHQAAQDHPRVGGEKGSGVISKIAGLGSPPRGRGKVMLFTLLPMGRGITPAWAGKSMIVRSVCLSSVDHPRVGGEKQMQEQAGKYWVGSPPRGRGKAIKDAGERQAARITPAWAGKSTTSGHETTLPRDHPRVGGEKLACIKSD